MGTAFLYQQACLMGKLARLVNDSGLAAHYETLAANTSATFNGRFYDGKTARFAVCLSERCERHSLRISLRSSRDSGCDVHSGALGL